MRTSLNDLALIEESVGGEISPENEVLFRAKFLLDPEWKEKVNAQKEAYRLVRLYGREQLRMEIAAVGEKLFRKPEHSDFRQKIFRLFFKNQ